MRSGVANKAVLSYSAILQPGGSSGGGGVVGSSVMAKKEGHTPSQPLLLQAAPPTTVKGAALAKTAGATISIITGKVGSVRFTEEITKERKKGASFHNARCICILNGVRSMLTLII